MEEPMEGIEETSISGKLKKILKEILRMEISNGRHTKAVFKPKRSDIIRKKEKYLDSLARLITKEEGESEEEESKEARDICVAVCQVEVDGKKKLLIANNLEEPKGPKEFLPLLQKFANAEVENQSKVFTRLFELSVNNSFAIIQRTSGENRWKNTGSIKGKKINELKKEIISYSRRVKNKSLIDKQKKESLEKIFKWSLDSSEEMKRENISDSSNWELLVPIDDLNIIINAIKDRSLGQELIEIIKIGDFKYIMGKKDEHAEMKIVNWLLEKGQKGKYYIGISKLTCSPCWAVIENINKDESKGLLLNARGTHGATYGENWEIPANIEEYGESLIDVFESKLPHEKPKESTSEVQITGVTQSDLFTAKELAGQTYASTSAARK